MIIAANFVIPMMMLMMILLMMLVMMLMGMLMIMAMMNVINTMTLNSQKYQNEKQTIDFDYNSEEDVRRENKTRMNLKTIIRQRLTKEKRVPNK